MLVRRRSRRAGAALCSSSTIVARRAAHQGHPASAQGFHGPAARARWPASLSVMAALFCCSSSSAGSGSSASRPHGRLSAEENSKGEPHPRRPSGARMQNTGSATSSCVLACQATRGCCSWRSTSIAPLQTRDLPEQFDGCMRRRKHEDWEGDVVALSGGGRTASSGQEKAAVAHDLGRHRYIVEALEGIDPLFLPSVY